MDPEVLAMIAQYAQRSGIGSSPSPFGGSNDMLLGSFGMPTSVNMPSTYNANALGLMQGIRESYISKGGDQALNRITQATGIEQRAAAGFIGMFPQLQNMFSTRADLTGGAFTMAQSMNPYLGTTLEPGQQAGATFKNFEKGLYTQLRTDLDDGRYDGIRSERDAGAILSFATQTGQASLPTRKVKEDGSIGNFNAKELTSSATAVLDQFDGLLEAGRQIFGPDAPAKQILQRMRQIGGDVFNKSEGDALAKEVKYLAANAYTNGANVQAVFQNVANTSTQLQSYGMESRRAYDIANDSANYAVVAAAGNRRARAHFKDQGFNIGELNYETFASAATQARVQYESRNEIKMRKAKMALGNLGLMGEGGDAAAGALSLLGTHNMEFIDAALTADQLKVFGDEADTTYAKDTALDRYNALMRANQNKNINRGVVDNFAKARFFEGKEKAYDTMKLIRNFTDAEGDPDRRQELREKLRKVAGTDKLSDSDIKAMASVDMAVGAYELADIARLDPRFDQVSDDAKRDAFGNQVEKTSGERLLESIEISRSDKRNTAFTELVESKEGFSRTMLGKDTIEELKLDEKSYEELKDLGIYAHKERDAETKDVVSSYVKVNSEGDMTVQEAFESVEGTSFSDKAKVFVDILIDKAGDFFKEAGVLNVKLEED